MNNPAYSVTSTVVETSVPLAAGCSAISWSPEVISLYGDTETILGKLNKFELGLDDRRVFILTVESAAEAQISFYEKTSSRQLTVKKWRGVSQGSVSARLEEIIIENKGVHCVGEQSKAILGAFPDVKEDTDIPIPVNAKAAFSHAIRAFGDKYLKATIYLMC